MKPLFTLLSVAALAVALPSGALAAEKKTAAEKAEKTSAEKVAGTTKPLPMNARADSVDLKAKTFTMKRKDGVEVKHVVTDKTEGAAMLSQVKVGDYVSGLRLKKSDTEYEVVKITKSGPLAKKPKAEGEAKPEAKKP